MNLLLQLKRAWRALKQKHKRAARSNRNRSYHNFDKDNYPLFRRYKRLFRGVVGASTWKDLRKQVVSNHRAALLKKRKAS